MFLEKVGIVPDFVNQRSTDKRGWGTRIGKDCSSLHDQVNKQRPAKGFATGSILCVCLYNFYLRFSVNFTGAESALAGFPKLINLKLRIIITLRSHDF